MIGKCICGNNRNKHHDRRCIRENNRNRRHDRKNASVKIIDTGVMLEKYICENNRNRRHNRKIHLWEAFVRTRETKTMINPCCPLTTIICPWVPLLEPFYSLYVLFVQQQAKYSMLKYLRAGTQKQVHFCTKNCLTKVCSPPVLSEHCFAGKCSTSHVLNSGEAWNRPWWARAASEASCAAALVSPLRALMQRVRSRIISASRLSPEVWCAPLGPSGPAASHWLDNSQIQRLDPEKNPRKPSPSH